MTSHPLSEDYLRWLAPQIREEDNGETYDDLVTIMYEKEFVWVVPYDDNRMADGLDLRTAFCYAHHIRQGSLADLPCSFLEVLIGLSHRLAFDAGGTPPGWAWVLITNLELHKMADPLTPRRIRKVNDILDGCIWRNYRPDGCGGFFPLAWPETDQRKVELWYQMASWVSERHPEWNTI